MKQTYLCVRQDNQLPSWAEINSLRSMLRTNFGGLGFKLLEEPFTAKTVFAHYDGLDRGEADYVPDPADVQRETFENKRYGGCLIVEYAQTRDAIDGSFGFLVDVEGPEVDGNPSSLYADVAMITLGLRSKKLLAKINKLTRRFTRLRASTDGARNS